MDDSACSAAKLVEDFSPLDHERSDATGDSEATEGAGRECEPALSILVPIYNVQDYLRECLDSLLRQDFDDYEAILLNDGSTDASGQIAHEYAARDSRFRVIDKSNSGYGATLNIGLSQARGTYVGFLESDDIMYDGALERLVTAIEAYDADLVRGTFSLYWSQGPHDVEVHPYCEELLNREVDTRREFRVYLFKSAIWSGVYRRSLLEDNSIRFLETPGASYQDTSFAFKTYAASATSVFLDEPIIHYRQDNEGSSVHSRGKVYAVSKEFDEIDRWLSRRNDPDHIQTLRRASVVARSNAYLWNVDRIAPEFRSEFIHFMSLEFSKMDDAGRIDWDNLDSWRALNIRKVIEDPDHYLRVRETFRGDSTLSKAAFSLELGGPQGLIDAMRERRSR